MKQIRKYIILLVFSPFFSATFAQSLEDYLQLVRENHPQIIALRAEASAENLQMDLGWLPENPEGEYGYFPGNENAPGNKTVYGIKQKLLFPTSYIRFHKFNQLTKELIEVRTNNRIQQILLESKIAYLDYIYLKEKQQILSEKLANDSTLKSHLGKKLESGEISVLEYNKANIRFQNTKSILASLHAEIAAQAKILAYFSGNEIASSNYSFDAMDTEIIVLDTILASDLLFVQLNALEKQLDAEKQFQKSGLMPAISVGYETERVANEDFSGFRAGVEIPLWGTAKKTKLIHTKHNAGILTQKQEQEQAIKFYEGIYDKTLVLMQQLDQLNKISGDMENPQLLQQAYIAGQISSIEYFVELENYFEFYFQHLDLKYNTNKNLAILTKYKL